MFTIVSQGTFTQPATAVNQYIPLPSGADYFTTTNLTQMATTETTGVNVRGEWYGAGLTGAADGLSWVKTNSTNAINISTFATLGAVGFTYVTAYPAPGPQVTGTTITQANGAVASAVNTLSNGDQIIIYNAVGMEQISSMPFTVSSVSGTGFTLLGLNSSGFATPATAFYFRKISPFTPVVPQSYVITAVTQATQGVVTTSQAHNYVVGQKIEFNIPQSCGMVQLNNFYQASSKPIIITAVTAYTFTINVNTSGYTAFALPASTLSPTAVLPPTVAPAGQATTYNPITGVTTGYNFTSVPFHSGLFLPYMYIPSGAQNPGGSANDVIVYQAFKMETGTINGPVPS